MEPLQLRANGGGSIWLWNLQQIFLNTVAK
jgi:hypothetical protein